MSSFYVDQLKKLFRRRTV